MSDKLIQNNLNMLRTEGNLTQPKYELNKNYELEQSKN